MNVQPPPNRSVPELFGDVVSEISTLFRTEVRLARAEMGEKLARASGALGIVVAGGVLLLAALIILLQAVVTFVLFLGIPLQWAQVIVAVVVALIGYVLLRSGLGGLKISKLAPDRTAQQLSRDAAVVKEQVR